jgi:Cu-Zn family superoxide dismutase
LGEWPAAADKGQLRATPTRRGIAIVSDLVATDRTGMPINRLLPLVRMSMRHLVKTSLVVTLLLTATQARAEDITVKMFKATQSGNGDAIGMVTISDTDKGASFKLALHGLPPGTHGFHVHENGNCGPTLYSGGLLIPAGAAGGHLDPDHTGKHLGPNGEGHLGDLPVMEVEANGSTDQTLIAPRIKDTGDLKGRSLVINVGGDNYKDTPLLDGGGGGRIACGVIP